MPTIKVTTQEYFLTRPEHRGGGHPRNRAFPYTWAVLGSSKRHQPLCPSPDKLQWRGTAGHSGALTAQIGALSCSESQARSPPRACRRLLSPVRSKSASQLFNRPRPETYCSCANCTPIPPSGSRHLSLKALTEPADLSPLRTDGSHEIAPRCPDTPLQALRGGDFPQFVMRCDAARCLHGESFLPLLLAPD